MALDREHVIARLEEENGERDLSGLDLAGADLSRLDLRGVNLSRADLSSADLRWAVLEGADLHSTVLRRADARWAIFRGANLRQADLGRANLSWADISGADVTGADLDGATLDNVHLGDTVVERRPRSGEWRLQRAVAGAGAGGGTRVLPTGLARAWALPEVTPLTVAAAIVAALLLVQLWGWMFRMGYFLDAFGLPADSGVVSLGQGANFLAGLRIVLLAVLTLIAAPLILLGLALLVAAVLALPVVLFLFGERILGDIVRPKVRPFVVGGLFVAYVAAFFLLFPFIAAGVRWLWAEGLPGGPTLGALFTLFRIGGLLTKLGFLVVLALTGLLLWLGWRWLCCWLTHTDFPTAWRLRYPAFNSAVMLARDSRLFRRNEPLTGEERRRGLLAALGLLLLLPTVLTGVGRVFAYQDMCDGGDLPRVQLYTNRKPTQPLADSLLCERLLTQTDSTVYVFFPSQTKEQVPGDLASRQAQVSAVDQASVVEMTEAQGSAANCPTCAQGPTGGERYLIDPDMVETAGAVTDHTGNLLLLDVPAELIGSVRLGANTVVTKDGQPSAAENIVAGDMVRAFGTLASDGITLDASAVNVVTLAETTPDLPPPTLASDLTNPEAIVIFGSSWSPDHQVQIGLLPPGTPPGPNAKMNTLDTVQVQPDGSFAPTISYEPQMPTTGYQLIAIDPQTRQYATAPWYPAPPPTPTPRPTQPPPTIETTPGPDTGTGTPTPAGAATPTGAATNTPFPTAPGTTAPGGALCDRDQFEYDSTRPFQKPIYISLGTESSPQQHNFCPRGDVDLAYFQVKTGRWYRVTTSDLAPGVDTVMAVGDLSDSTPCQPPGCWNDDASAMTFASEIVFQAVQDANALITVSNRGALASGTDATYKLLVVQFEPTPTPTPTLEPSPTASSSPSPTPTRLPFIDRWENTRGTNNDACRRAFQYLELNRWYDATLFVGSDQDLYESVTLNPGDYRAILQVPKKQNYDLEVLQPVNPSRDDCPPWPGLTQGWNSGEGEDEVVYFSVVSPTGVILRVFTPFTNVYGSPYDVYRLRLEPVGTIVPPVPTATLSPTPRPTPTITLTPSLTPTAAIDVVPTLSPTP